jgi:amino acid adenylation domain-containing protein
MRDCQGEDIPLSLQPSQSAWGDFTMLDLFEQQVGARPEATAVSSGNVDVSYAELDQSSDRVAGWLVQHNVVPEDIVAVEMSRDSNLVVALLGVLKAGAAYLALELDAPRSRRDRLIADARASAVITSPDQPGRDLLPTLRMCTDFEPHDDAGRFKARPVQPESLAYVCYTSGSTGQPKGVCVPHSAVVRLVAGDYCKFGPGQTFLLLSPVSFDASTFEIWAPLLTGGRVVIHPAGPLAPEDLVSVLKEQKVTTLFLTTALFHRMVHRNLEVFAGICQLLTGGEVLNPALFNRFFERFPKIRLIAAYGPTENTAFTTCQTIAEPVHTPWVTLGQPIAGTHIQILDSSLKPVPLGADGELCVSGAGLSRGYLGQPAATAASFVPDPFGSPGSRMYCTGDLARQHPEGGLEFIGRGDRQVKVRGFRVEPAEVEREISTIPGVKEAVVATYGSYLEEKHLIAYLVPDSGDNDPGELAARVRKRLRGTLQAAMIPTAFVTLNQLPLTPNGKIDRALLPVPERSTRLTDSNFVAPRSSTEQLLCDIWAESLNIQSVGVQDDFFELGGNSLLALDLIDHTEKVFDVELPVRELLYHPTIEEFAGVIENLLVPGSVRA